MSKDGDVIRYVVAVTRLHEPGTEEARLVREYEDLAYLDHQLATTNTHQPGQWRHPTFVSYCEHSAAGIIFPPLPAKPSTDPAAAESRSKRQLGSGSRSVLGDGAQWGRDCAALEKYLEMVVSHPVTTSAPLSRSIGFTSKTLCKAYHPVRPL